MSKNVKVVSIVGGGSSAHVLIPFLSKAGYQVNLLTRKPESWGKKTSLEFQSDAGEVKAIFKGELNLVSDNPALVLKNANFIILCLPVSCYKTALNKIAPYINNKNKIYLGTIYGQGGFNWMVGEIKKKYKLYRIVTFAIGLIPWICRTKKYGKTGILYSDGPKAKNIVAVYPTEEYHNIKNNFLNDICYRWFQAGKFCQSKNFISLTLSVDNQIIHPSRLYGLYLKNPSGWRTEEEIPFFYRDFDDISANILRKVDEDYSKIRVKIKAENPHSDFRYMMNYTLLDQFTYDYDFCNENIKKSFTASKTLGLIKTPVVKNKDNKWVLNKRHRYFTDDIFYGLCIAKGFAEHFSLKVPMIDELLNWAQTILGISLINNGNLKKECTLNGFEVGVYENYRLSLNDSLQ